MKNIFLIIWLFCTFPLMAQQIMVEDFQKAEKLKGHAKKTAILDLYTNEDSFEFIVEDSPVNLEQMDGFYRLFMPNKTTNLTIKHPKYGQLRWKIPGKGLKKKKHYQAYLKTESIDKEFQLKKQWLVLSIRPRHAIVYIDSTMHTVQNGMLSLFLPVGSHPCKIISPFYQELTDTIEIKEENKVEKSYELATYYAFLTVETNDPQTQIFLDRQLIGHDQAHTGRIQPGRYHLVIQKNGMACYDQRIEIANAENKVIRFARNELQPFSEIHVRKAKESLANPSDPSSHDNPSGNFSITTTARPDHTSAWVTIHAFDDTTAIWINREMKGLGTWQGELKAGFYALSTQKQGLDSRTSYFWVDPGKDTEINLKSPLADYGMINIESNVINATVLINGLKVGSTPCVIKHLPAYQNYKIQLIKGRQKAERIVALKANDIIHVNIQLKMK